MAKWAFVENNEIKELHDFLPKNWRNVSGLYTLYKDLEALNALGWLPVQPNYGLYDPNQHTITALNHHVDGNVVVETPVYVDRPQSLVEANKAAFMQQLREQRNARLAASDWTQLNDAMELMGAEQAAKWKLYRQALRDLPQQYQQTDVVDLDAVVWPTV